MNRHEKTQLVGSLKQGFEQNPAAFVIGMQGLTVAQVNVLRRQVRQAGGSFKVAKNSLLRLATHDMDGVQLLDAYFKNQIAIVFAQADVAMVAKLLCNFSAAHEKMTIIGGCFQARVIDPGMVKFLGTLPPVPVLQAQVCGVIRAPLSNTVGVLSQILGRLVYVLKAASEKQ